MHFSSWSGRRERSHRHLAFNVILGVTGAAAIALFSPVAVQAQSLAEDCNQFAETINQNEALFTTFGAEIAAFSETVSQAETLADIQSAAQQYVSAVGNVTTGLDDLEIEIADLPLADTDLSDYRSQYVGVLSGFQNALNQISDAMEAVANAPTEEELLNTLDRLEQDTDLAINDIDQIAIAESQLIDTINNHCGVNP